MALVLQGKKASLVHNGGAYGDGTAESGIGVACGAARAVGPWNEGHEASRGIAGCSNRDVAAETVEITLLLGCISNTRRMAAGNAVGRNLPEQRDAEPESPHRILNCRRTI